LPIIVFTGPFHRTYNEHNLISSCHNKFRGCLSLFLLCFCLFFDVWTHLFVIVGSIFCFMCIFQEAASSMSWPWVLLSCLVGVTVGYSSHYDLRSAASDIGAYDDDVLMQDLYRRLAGLDPSYFLRRDDELPAPLDDRQVRVSRPIAFNKLRLNCISTFFQSQ